MAVYAIGDIQGCDRALRSLLDKIRFNPGNDQLWLVGDLVNRGPHSSDVLRRIMDLGADSVRAVLGNHDLHLIAMSRGVLKPRRKDTAADVLDQPDSQELLDWLGSLPLLVRDDGLGMIMVHAGIHPHWSNDELADRAREVESCLRDATRRDEYLNHMYGGQPDRWDDSLSGWDRLRLITNIFTRMRYCRADGTLDLKEKLGPLQVVNPELRPWYELLDRDLPQRIVFGHWSTLGLKINRRIVALDTGCVWHGSLTSVRLDDPNLPVAAVNCG